MRNIWKEDLTLDGGMGTELSRCGAKDVDQHVLWSHIVNINQPEIVVQAHSNFIEAGADVIITNSYKTMYQLGLTFLFGNAACNGQ